MADDQQKHQGWANHETRCVNLWLTNDEGLYKDVRELVRGSKDTNGAAEAIKEYVDGFNPLASQATQFTDLVNAALSEVDWGEIAEGFLAEISEDVL